MCVQHDDHRRLCVNKYSHTPWAKLLCVWYIIYKYVRQNGSNFPGPIFSAICIGWALISTLYFAHKWDGILEAINTPPVIITLICAWQTKYTTLEITRQSKLQLVVIGATTISFIALRVCCEIWRWTILLLRVNCVVCMWARSMFKSVVLSGLCLK
jgi:hypothetical protein